MIDKFVRAQLQLVPIEPEVDIAALKVELKTLEDERDEYIRRLDDGSTRIADAAKEHKDVTAWEDHWLRLLYLYEQKCDAIRACVARFPEGAKEVRAAKPARKDDIFNDNFA